MFNCHTDHFDCVLTGSGNGAVGPSRSARLLLLRGEVTTVVEDVRHAWQKGVIDYRVDIPDSKEREYPFLDGWDHRDTPQHLNAVGPGLAIAGNKLFNEVFRPPKAGPELMDIARRIQLASATGPMTIEVISDCLFLPWWLMYTQPDGTELSFDGSNWMPEGFWGARHAIEHRIPAPGDYYRMEAADGRLRVGLNVDSSMDTKQYKVVAPVVDFFKRDGRFATKDRTTRNELARAMRKDEFDDQIAYFCCHMKVAGDFAGRDGPNFAAATMTLTDEPITVLDVRFWLEHRQLEAHPLVFFNCCQGGQMQSLFYHSFAAELLARAANCVVGSQVDVPYVFAPEYARQFFEDFLKGNRRVGFIVRDLANVLLRDHNNPLGLAFSLYQGLDTYLAPIGA
jgi:hypothetical protein